MNFLSQLLGGNNVLGGNNANSLNAAEYKRQYVLTNTRHRLVDVRSPQEYAYGHVTGAVNIPVQELQQRLNELPRDLPIMLYCRSGSRSGMALQLLQAAGFTEVYNIGSLSNLLDQDLPLHQLVTA